MDTSKLLPDSLKNNGKSFGDLFNEFLRVGLIVLAIAAFIGIVYSGVMMITSGGDASKFTTARKSLIMSVIGVIVITLSFFLVQLTYGVLQDLTK